MLQCGLVMRKLSVCLLVRLSVERVICDKRKKLVPTFLYHMKII